MAYKEKKTLFYERRTDLLENEADFIAIEEDGSICMVFAAYRTNGHGIEGVPACVREQSDISILPMDEAREKYNFKQLKDSKLGGEFLN